MVAIARGTTFACPVKLVERLIEEGSLQPSVPLFQGFDGHKAASKSAQLVKLDGEHISYGQAHYQILKYLAKVLGCTHKEAQDMFGLHSLRSGGATDVAAVLAKNDIPEHVFQAHGAWKSREAMLVYIQRSLATKLQVTQVMGY